MNARAVIDFVEKWMGCAQHLDELVRHKVVLFGLQAFHCRTCGHSQERVWVVGALVRRSLHFFQTTFELIDAFQALEDRIHIARISKVFEACGHHDCSCFIHGSCALCWRHVLQKLDSLSRFAKTLLFSRTHHHQSHASLQAKLG